MDSVNGGDDDVGDGGDGCGDVLVVCPACAFGKHARHTRQRGCRMWHGLTGDSSSGDASIESDSGPGEETDKEAAATVLDNRGHTGRVLTQLASDEGHGTIIHPASTSDSDLVSDAESESESGSGRIVVQVFV